MLDAPKQPGRAPYRHLVLSRVNWPTTSIAPRVMICKRLICQSRLLYQADQVANLLIRDKRSSPDTPQLVSMAGCHVVASTRISRRLLGRRRCCCLKLCSAEWRLVNTHRRRVAAISASRSTLGIVPHGDGCTLAIGADRRGGSEASYRCFLWHADISARQWPPLFNRDFAIGDDGIRDADKAGLLALLKSKFLPTQDFGLANVVLAWHGCGSEAAADAMCRNGVTSLRFTDPGFFGAGIYVALEAPYAAGYSTGVLVSEDPAAWAAPPTTDGCYVMLLCAVAVG